MNKHRSLIICNKVALTLGLLSSHILFSQFQQNTFLTGVYWPPNIQPFLHAVPEDYDGDGKADLGIKTDGGSWLIDYSGNGFNGWEWTGTLRGGSEAHPVPADYDGDGKADLSVKTDNGNWLIDYANDGFNGWEWTGTLRGGSEAHPVPADYDGDGKADLSVKTDNGNWLIDYAKDGFNGWEWTGTLRGGSEAHPVPADYDGDGKADLSVKTDSGNWLIDYAKDGFNGWEWTGVQKGGIEAKPIAADYDGDGKADLSVKTNEGNWLIDYAKDGFNGWEWTGTQRGGSDAKPVPADYDGDGKADISIKTDSDSWYIDTYADGMFSGWNSIYNLDEITPYNLLGLNPADLSNFNRVKSAYIDLLISPESIFNNTHYTKVDYYLNLAAHESLKVLISNNKIMSFSDPALSDTNNQQFINHFKNNIPSLLKEAIFGINLGDEPAPTNLQNVNKWNLFFKNNYNQKPTYYNLLPRYGDFASDTAYENYLDNFINSNSSDIVSFDHYPFDGSIFLNSYFYNLSKVKEKSQNKPFWMVIPSHKDYSPVPYEAKLKFQAFCPIAYGAKGLMYWSYVDGFENDPMKYESIQKINRFLKEIVGPVVINNKNTATLHKNNTPLNQGYPFSTHELIQDNNTVIRDVKNEDILLGVFETEKTSNTKTSYVWIVNKNVNTSASQTKIYLKGYLVGKILISPRVDSYDPQSPNYQIVSDAYFDNQNNQTIINLPDLYPGEGIMLKVNQYISSTNKDYDGDGKADISIKTDTGKWLIDYAKNGFNGWDWTGTQRGGVDSHPVSADYDGDGITDLSVKTDTGNWLIDYAKNGFNGWDWTGTQRGDVNSHPVSADYDGDGITDLSVKTDTGNWLIDYAKNGFNGWDWTGTQRGDVNSHPVSADYDGDGAADLSVKTDDGTWLIDYANNGFDGWEWTGTQRGNAEAHPVPADYDGDGLADLSVKTDAGTWLIDYAKNGFDGWDWTGTQRGGGNAHPAPADYDGDGMTDLSVKTDDGKWYIDYAYNGFDGWDWTGTDRGGLDTSVARKAVANNIENKLYQNTPNPFNTSTTIEYFLVDSTKTAEINVFNQQGIPVKKYTLDKKGKESIRLESSMLPSGIYYYNLIVDGQQLDTKKMIIQ
ncbi:putative transglutaminase-like cysteine proteinase [Chryseobacterium rhizosphaerae]|uniref:FG-GAP-like repeat-containing protein n=1 Tax=Chryseobacterium rhizosphaerae TaxID=395937 RepID=UPI00285A15B4|nr:FG-GAP-like repeat-containing protein [Chryseobacterium rhizosphaerae]MDR6547710.1 putative transglutaminase-like cysteine proteinase [Chryseobacterium rhizosphaerae]